MLRVKKVFDHKQELVLLALDCVTDICPLIFVTGHESENNNLRPVIQVLVCGQTLA